MENRKLSFKKVSDESYKDVAPYIDALIPYVSFLSDLYLVDLDGHHFLVTESNDKLIIVDNDAGTLNTYSLEFDSMGRIVKYSDDLGEYELSLEMEGNVKGVRSVDKLSGVIDQLVYFPQDENNPRINIDYYQYFPNDVSSLIFNYDVTDRNSIDASLLYIDYHYPNKIILSQLVYFMKMIGRKREIIFYDDFKGNQYCRALFKFRDILFSEFNKRYPKDEVLHAIEDLGYKIKIPSKISDLLCESDDELKRLQLLSYEYKFGVKDKKIQ